MEPTPELKAVVGGIATGGTDGELLRSLIANAKELRAALLPFERAAEMSPAVRAAVERGKANVERLRATDEALAQRIGADKPAYTARQSWLRRVLLTIWYGSAK